MGGGIGIRFSQQSSFKRNCSQLEDVKVNLAGQLHAPGLLRKGNRMKFVQDIRNIAQSQRNGVGYLLTVFALILFQVSKIRVSDVKVILIFSLVFLVMNNLLIYLFSPEHGVSIYNTRTVLCSI